MKHCIIIRANFKDEKLFQKYLVVAKEVLIPQLNNQKNKNFTIIFTINDLHKETLKSLIDNRIELKFFKEFRGDVKDYLETNFYEIQTRHDFDDWMSLDYIDNIQKIWIENKSMGANNLLIQSQPVLYDFNNKTIKKMNSIYSEIRTSMHLSLCQKENKNFIFEKNHNQMFQISKNIKLLPKNNTRLVIHNNNTLSTMKS